jgi:hypothetical protein
METTAILWRSLEPPGHDACRLLRRDGGWRLEGAAVFRHEGVAACLAYSLDCDGDWRTREGTVHGWIGGRAIDIRIARAADGHWTLNDRLIQLVNECVDLDFGFTPSTNLVQLRRAALDVGQATEIPVAWLDVGAGTLDTLHQRYERRTEGAYWYEAPRFGYRALLEVNAVGFVEAYPGLWEAER